MGLVSGETGRGTFVREPEWPAFLGTDTQTAAASMADLSFNYPSLPGQAEQLRAALRQLAQSGDLDALLRYQPHGGRPHERAVAARHLATHGLRAPAERVLIVCGAQHGLAVAATALLRPGDVVAVDALTYYGFRAWPRRSAWSWRRSRSAPGTGPGRAGTPVPRAPRARHLLHADAAQSAGLGAGSGGPAAAGGHRASPRPDRDRGSGLRLSGASAAGAAGGLAPERTVYVSGLSKSVAAGLRVGFIAAPDAWLPAMERVIRSSTWNTPAVMSAIACMWMEDGTVAALEQAKREDARVRQALARRVLADLPVVAHPSSYFLWIPLAEEARADQIAMSLQRQQVAVTTAEPFATTSQVPHAIRLALGSVDMAVLEDLAGEDQASGAGVLRKGSGSSSAVSSALSITASIPVRVSRLAVKPAIASRSAGQ